MPRLCYGGTFNPLHYGHLICARAAAEAAGFDQVILIPSRQSPHKQLDTTIVTAEHRLEMCRLAVAGDPFFGVLDLELQRPGPSYTIDTARQLRSEGWPLVDWLIGLDMARGLPAWHKPADLLAEVVFHLMDRPGWSLDWSTMPTEYRHLKERIVKAPLIEISSTTIRNRIAAGQSIRYLVPPEVAEYIGDNRLYRTPLET